MQVSDLVRSRSRWSLLQWLLVRKDNGGFKLPVQIHDVRWFALPWWHAMIARCEGGIAMEADEIGGGSCPGDGRRGEN